MLQIVIGKFLTTNETEEFAERYYASLPVSGEYMRKALITQVLTMTKTAGLILTNS